jgi:hypothetical protein
MCEVEEALSINEAKQKEEEEKEQRKTYFILSLVSEVIEFQALSLL